MNAWFDDARVPRRTASLRTYVRRHPVNSMVSALLIGIACHGLVLFVNWAIVDSVTDASSTAECRRLGHGACWAVIRERGRLVLFGLYPYEEQWRPSVACMMAAYQQLLGRANQVAN